MIDHELMRIPTTKEPPMNHKKKLLATTAAVAVAATIAAPTSADAQLIEEARPTTDLGLDLPLTLEGTDR